MSITTVKRIKPIEDVENSVLHKINLIITTPVESLTFYKLGLIDQACNLIRQPENDYEKQLLTPLSQYALSVKKLLVCKQAADFNDYDDLDSKSKDVDDIINTDSDLSESVKLVDLVDGILSGSETRQIRKVEMLEEEKACDQMSENYLLLNRKKRTELFKDVIRQSITDLKKSTEKDAQQAAKALIKTIKKRKRQGLSL
ncbi:hypothetical protein ACRTC3_07635 [Photobacterium damselae]|uniref:hypothetical protein n=1 Tax=Photobacterium damselae TaxID=38293 RepID=UPI003D7CC7B1